ncbi:MAG: arylamine N-acetyltransferase [Terriglobia bacterium]|nr:MAG: arylamine N-acetyltransferase [Terriglobia bacterium]
MTVDLEAYAARIQYHGSFAPTLDTFRNLHLAHATHIPFENLDVLLRRPIHLDLESLWTKLVKAGRGGYCFEHNTLFAAVLESVGFSVVRFAARVRMGASSVRPRTHMILAVGIDNETWLADVGFGSEGLLYPVRLQPDLEVAQFAWRYRVITENGICVLQCWRPEGWLDMYAFTLDPQYPIDYEVANYFTSTHPDSPFVHTLIAQRPAEYVRLTLLNRKLIERRPESTSELVLPDDDAVLDVLSNRFGLHFPRGTCFPHEESILSVQATR